MAALLAKRSYYINVVKRLEKQLNEEESKNLVLQELEIRMQDIADIRKKYPKYN